MTTLVIWCSAYVTYLIFAGTLSADELGVAAVLASLSALWAYALRENSRRRFSAAWADIPPVLKALGGLYPAAARTGAVLLRTVARGGSPGRARPRRFRFGPADEARERGRRALAVLCASLAPDRFVVNVERGRSEALLHAVTGRTDRPPDPEWLE